MNTTKWIIGALALTLGVAWTQELRAQEYAAKTVEHIGHIEDDGGITWRVRMDGSPVNFGSDEPRRVTFEQPLGDAWRVLPPAVPIRDEEGRIVAAHSLECCERTTRKNFRWQTASVLGLAYEGPDVVLPALAGDAPERFWLENGRFALAAGSPLEKQIGALVAGGMSEGDRDELEDFFGEVPTSARPVVYAHQMPAGSADGAGLVRAESHDAFRKRALWYGGAGFLACLLLIAGGLRWLRDDARAEQAEAYLREVDEEIGAL